MTKTTKTSSVNQYGSFMSRLPLGRMLTSAIPFMVLALPGTAYAQSVSNTATVSVPAGATDTNTANN